jgi:CHASE2 domain-containing sensor protein
VIIAPNNIGTSDRHFSPYSRGVARVFDNEPMIGGEVHANAIETILSGIYPRSLSLWIAWPALVLVLVCRGGALPAPASGGRPGRGFGFSRPY